MKWANFLTFGVLTIVLVSCGGDSSEIDRLRFLADDIRVGESVRVELEATIETDEFGQTKAVSFVFSISDKLLFEEDSVRIFEGIDDDTEVIIPDGIQNCLDGRTLFQIRLSRDDLEGNGFGGDEFKIKFNVTGKAVSQGAVVGASINDDDSFNCLRDFAADESDFVEIDP